jgi:hypothetical protein
MVPRIILRQIGRLRRRETLLRLTWGLARVLALALVLLALACLTDWIIDRFEDTPWPVTLALFTGQLVAAALAVVFFVILPLARRPDDVELALGIEARHRSLGHRLISAVQLNRPDAETEGMSPQLIDRLTREAEQRAEKLPVTQVADHRRLGWSAALLLPLLATAAVPVLLWPDTVLALLNRQLLGDDLIPRSVYLTAEAPEVWYRPSNEEVVLYFRARGEGVDEDIEGEVRVERPGRPAETYPLKREKMLDAGEALFAARVPPSSHDFTYRAWLDDGRTPSGAEVRYAARPVVKGEPVAWVLLPEFVGLRPESKLPYEKEAKHGEVIAIPGSSARVRVEITKPVREAAVELLRSSRKDREPETVTRRVPLEVEGDGSVAMGTFDLRPDETAYRVVVTDEHGFDNVPPPKRGIRLIDEEKPDVHLLREEYRPTGRLASLKGPAADFEMEGLPVMTGGRFRVAYAFKGPYGVGAAWLRFRVLRKASATNDGPSEMVAGKWHWLPLSEPKGSDKTGPFDPQRGVFQKSPRNAQIQFYAVPSPDPENVLGRTFGGGRFDLHSSGIPDDKRDYVKLHSGDQIEYAVVVYADRDKGAHRPFAESEVRRRPVISPLEYADWLAQVRQEEERIRQLVARQTGVFP